jgi:hypothetical protein
MSASSSNAGAAAPRSPGRPTSHIPPAGLDFGPGRRRVTRQDLVMYQALVGGPPQTVQARAVVGAGHVASNRQRPPTPANAQGGRRARKAWLPRVSRVLVLQLTDCYQGMSQRIGHPEVGEWLWRVSNNARRKIAQAHARFAHPHEKPNA